MRKLLVVLLALVISSQAINISVAATSTSGVKLNEVDCNNEWIEIVNTGPITVNLKNFYLMIVETDGTVLQDSVYLPVAKLKPGKLKTFSELELGFGIGCGEESVILQDPAAKEVDRVAIPNLLDGFTWSRFGDIWAGGVPTQNSLNINVANGQQIDQAAWIFDQLQSFRINITMADSDMNKLVQDPKTYVPATFRFRDGTGTLLPTGGALQVGIRTKGSVGSTNGGQVNIVNGKIGLKIKFNWSVPGQDFLGLKRLTLNNMLQDATMVRDVLSYQLFTDMGLIAPRTGFAKVYIDSGNGFRYKGLYLNLESYDEIMMARWRTSMQHMYDAMWSPGWNSFSNSCTGQWNPPEFLPENYRCNFEVDRGDPEDMDDLGNLVDALEDEDALTSEAKKIISVSQVAKFFAVEKYISHWDGQSGSPSWTPNNYRIFTDKNGKVELLPWGTDGTWFEFSPVPEWLIQGGVTSGFEPFDSARSKLFMQCIADDECMSEYLKALEYISTIANYQDYANQLYDVHADARAADTLRLADENTSAWSFQTTLNFIEERDDMAKDFVLENATGTLRWNPSKRILTAGQKLTVGMLNAYSDVNGTITYSKKLGAVLKKGKYFIKATLTPTDSDNWPVQQKTLKFTVK